MQNKLYLVARIQPAARFSALHGAESAIFRGIFPVLIGITVVAIRPWRV